MLNFKVLRFHSLLVLLAFSTNKQVAAQPASVTNSPYKIYSGNTHAHTRYTWSHGEQFEKSSSKGIAVFGGDFDRDSVDQWKAGYVSDSLAPAILILRSSQYPGPNMQLKKDWRTVQGYPAVHFELAKKNGYDFYVTTDHSQEYALNPPAADNSAWANTGEAAETATDKGFVALRGFEHSENNGPNGQGHINIINSATYINALDPEVDLPYLYKWLQQVKPNGEGPVVGTFNHPGPKQYNNWAYRDDGVTDIITMLEVINSNNKIHYEGFINALEHGWKVSPVCGNDNHGLSGIKNHTSRTFVLATAKTKAAILDAMKNRRTYASLDQNIQCTYSVNRHIMGSTIEAAISYAFNINISDPDVKDPKNKITKVEIIGDSGRIVETYNHAGAWSINWKPVIKNAQDKYFFIRVWNAGGGDAKNADAKEPVAWLAPVWINRK